MPLRGEWTHNLIENGDCELGEFSAARAMLPENLSGQGKYGVYTVQSRFFIALVRRKRLGCDTREKFNVELPSGLAISIARSEVSFEEASLDFKVGKSPAC